MSAMYVDIPFTVPTIKRQITIKLATKHSKIVELCPIHTIVDCCGRLLEISSNAAREIGCAIGVQFLL